MNLLVTGRPGVGKTTVVEKVVSSLPSGGVAGFITREIREKGERTGFSLETLDGQRVVLAHVGLAAGPRVGRYRVNLESIAGVAVPAIAPHAAIRLIVIDEIGKMECLSPPFPDAVRRALDAPVPVLATIARTGGGLIEEIRRRRDVTLVEVTLQNRDTVPDGIVAALGLHGQPGDEP